MYQLVSQTGKLNHKSSSVTRDILCSFDP